MILWFFSASTFANGANFFLVIAFGLLKCFIVFTICSTTTPTHHHLFYSRTHTGLRIEKKSISQIIGLIYLTWQNMNFCAKILTWVSARVLGSATKYFSFAAQNLCFQPIDNVVILRLFCFIKNFCGG